MTERHVTRRQAIGGLGGLGAALAMPTIIPASALGLDGKPPPSERISLGIIGVNGMGRGNLANCAKYADVVVSGDLRRLEAAVDAAVDSLQGHRQRASRLPRAAGAQGHRRRDHRHAAALARPDGHPGRRGRQGHLPAEADDAAPRRDAWRCATR